LVSDKGIVDPAKVISYGEAALAFPLADSKALAVGCRVVDAKAAHLAKLEGPALIGGQKEALMLCLRLLSGTGRHSSDFVPVEVPAVSKYDMQNATDPASKAALDLHNKEMAARSAAVAHNELADSLNCLAGKAVSLAKQLSLGKDDVRKVAAKVGCSGETIEQLVGKLPAKVGLEAASATGSSGAVPGTQYGTPESRR
jgi:hypothetical protein